MEAWYGRMWCDSCSSSALLFVFYFACSFCSSWLPRVSQMLSLFYIHSLFLTVAIHVQYCADEQPLTKLLFVSVFVFVF